MAHITQARKSNVLETFRERRTTLIGRSGRCSTRRLDGGGCQSNPARGGGRDRREGRGKKRGSGSAGLVEEKKKGRGVRERSGPESKVPFGCACARTESSPDTRTRTHTHAARWNEAKPVRGPAPSFFCLCLHTFPSNPDKKKCFWF